MLRHCACSLLCRSDECTEQNVRKVIELLTRSSSVDTACANNHFSLGVVYFDTDQYDEAIASLNKAIDLAPKDADAHIVRGMLFSKRATMTGRSPTLKSRLTCTTGLLKRRTTHGLRGRWRVRQSPSMVLRNLFQRKCARYRASDAIRHSCV